mmetsp:Transcript_4879/g.16908  ORF Transcript_4879/g.16908 Transcript_4879/m.16908 type:complete len:233 (+) Transcript_4879:3136-3834(+)
MSLAWMNAPSGSSASRFTSSSSPLLLSLADSRDEPNRGLRRLHPRVEKVPDPRKPASSANPSIGCRARLLRSSRRDDAGGTSAEALAPEQLSGREVRMVSSSQTSDGSESLAAAPDVSAKEEGGEGALEEPSSSFAAAAAAAPPSRTDVPSASEPLLLRARDSSFEDEGMYSHTHTHTHTPLSLSVVPRGSPPPQPMAIAEEKPKVGDTYTNGAARIKPNTQGQAKCLANCS